MRGVTVGRTGGRAGGSTLIETLAAIAVVSVALSILTRLTFSGLLQSEVTRQHTYAVLLAQERMEDALANADRLSAWEEEMLRTCGADAETDMFGFPDRAEPGYLWAWAVEPVESSPDLAELRVTVAWVPRRGRGRHASFGLVTRVLTPGYSAAENGLDGGRP